MSTTASTAEPPWIAAARRGRPLGELGGSLPQGHYFPAHQSPPRATLVCLHGIQTHSAWFSLMAPRLNARGFALLCPDRRGSGRREAGARGVADIGRHEDWLAEVDRTVTAAQGLGAPVFLVGASWGAKLALGYAAAQPARLDGVILLVPALDTTLENPLKKLLATLGGVVTPGASAKPGLTAAHYLPADAVDERFTEDFSRDPWLLDRATFRFLRESREMQREALRDLQRPSEPGLQMLALFAGGDRVVREASSRRLLAEIPRVETPQVLAAAGHGVQVLDADAAARLVADWLENRVGSAR